MKDKVEFFILLNQIVDILTFIFLGAEDLGCLFRDADADGVSTLGGGATGGKFVGTHSFCVVIIHLLSILLHLWQV